MASPKSYMSKALQGTLIELGNEFNQSPNQHHKNLIAEAFLEVFADGPEARKVMAFADALYNAGYSKSPQFVPYCHMMAEGIAGQVASEGLANVAQVMKGQKEFFDKLDVLLDANNIDAGTRSGLEVFKKESLNIFTVANNISKLSDAQFNDHDALFKIVKDVYKKEAPVVNPLRKAAKPKAAPKL